MKHVFEENIRRLREMFESAEGQNTKSHYIYQVHLNDELYADVFYLVPRDNPFLKNTTWVVEIRHFSDSKYRRGLKFQVDSLKAVVTASSPLLDDLFDLDAAVTLEIFVELIWKDIHEARREDYGLTAGSWLSGACLL